MLYLAKIIGCLFVSEIHISPGAPVFSLTAAVPVELIPWSGDPWKCTVDLHSGNEAQDPSSPDVSNSAHSAGPELWGATGRACVLRAPGSALGRQVGAEPAPGKDSRN